MDPLPEDAKPPASGGKQPEGGQRKRKPAVFSNINYDLSYEEEQKKIKQQRLEASVFRTVRPGEETKAVIDFMSEMMASGERIDTIPGQMPVSLGRITLSQIRQFAYWAGEKSDGERRLLVILNRQMYLVDRKLSMLSPILETVFDDKHQASLTKLFDSLDGTILDGELINHDEIQSTCKPPSQYPPDHKLAKFSFICFDVCCIRRDPRVANSPFSVRKFHFKSLTTEYLRSLSKNEHLSFHYKRFWARHDINTLMGTFRSVNLGTPTDFDSLFYQASVKRIFFYRSGDEVMWHLNDGIVFQPERAPYDGKWVCHEPDTLKTFVRDEQSVRLDALSLDLAPSSLSSSSSVGISLKILKWKWPEMNTIDFVVRHPFFRPSSNGLFELELFAQGDGTTVLVRRLDCTSSQKAEFERMLETESKGRGAPTEFVIECAYEV